MFCDADRSASVQLGILDETNQDAKGLPLTVRSVYIIKPDKTIALMMTYPASTGRNFDEILRVIDSLQLTWAHKVGTPVNWRDGDDVIVVPAVSNEDAIAQHGSFDAKLPYLRMVKQPK